MRISQILATALWQIGVQHAIAAPTPQVVDGKNLEEGRLDLLRRLCQNGPVPTTPGNDLGGTQYLADGHPNAGKPDPSTYQYAVYQKYDIVFKTQAISLVDGYRQKVNKEVATGPVPQGYEITLPHQLVSLKVEVKGDMNIIFSNLIGCLDAFDAFYAAQTERTVPFLQCAVHDQNYLEANVEMFAVKPSAEECASVPAIPDVATA